MWAEDSHYGSQCYMCSEASLPDLLSLKHPNSIKIRSLFIINYRTAKFQRMETDRRFLHDMFDKQISICNNQPACGTPIGMYAPTNLIAEAMFDIVMHRQSLIAFLTTTTNNANIRTYNR